MSAGGQLMSAQQRRPTRSVDAFCRTASTIEARLHGVSSTPALLPWAAIAPGDQPAAERRAPRTRPPSLAGIPVRVWAELGRTRMPSAQVVGMPAGSVVVLNQAADEPIDLYVNGTRFATGRLMVVGGPDRAVRIEPVLSSSNTSTDTQMEVARWPESW